MDLIVVVHDLLEGDVVSVDVVLGDACHVPRIVGKVFIVIVVMGFEVGIVMGTLMRVVMGIMMRVVMRIMVIVRFVVWSVMMVRKRGFEAVIMMSKRQTSVFIFYDELMVRILVYVIDAVVVVMGITSIMMHRIITMMHMAVIMMHMAAIMMYRAVIVIYVIFVMLLKVVVMFLVVIMNEVIIVMFVRTATVVFGWSSKLVMMRPTSTAVVMFGRVRTTKLRASNVVYFGRWRPAVLETS